MEETCALLQEELAPAAAPVASSRRPARRDALCFALGLATAPRSLAHRAFPRNHNGAQSRVGEPRLATALRRGPM